MLKTISATLFTLILSAAPANAVTITPPGPGGAALPFSAVGTATVGKLGIDFNCNTVFSGTVDGYGNIRITNATFKGATLCKLIKANASALAPWTGHVDTATQFTLDNVAVTINSPLGGGVCGPNKVVATINDNGSETILGLNAQLSGGCSINGVLNTSPYLQVKP
ncbi:activator protein [Iodobacter sp. HSC-16F04]|uniref:Activator protein n=1 Tax=Iodobacter violaceini TaxID=3044271 RepID=A0ABX0KP60_9NEIS|nr:activator protein [Iodobacter violacea]NHQ85536.1 activator protein [Iodobacter violacea]